MEEKSYDRVRKSKFESSNPAPDLQKIEKENERYHEQI